MIKIVNVNARIPIRNVVPPIHGYHAGLEMHTEDILKCLTRRAIVHEVLSDGKLVQLNMHNYYIDNEPVKKAVEVKEEAPKKVLTDTIIVSDTIEDIKAADTSVDESTNNVVEEEVTSETADEQSTEDTIEEVASVKVDTEEEDTKKDVTEDEVSEDKGNNPQNHQNNRNKKPRR